MATKPPLRGLSFLSFARWNSMHCHVMWRGAIMYAMHFDKNVEYTESELNTIDKVTKSATDDYFWQYSETDYVVKYFQQLLVLQTYLENKCIPISLLSF